MFSMSWTKSKKKSYVVLARDSGRTHMIEFIVPSRVKTLGNLKNMKQVLMSIIFPFWHYQYSELCEYFTGAICVSKDIWKKYWQADCSTELHWTLFLLLCLYHETMNYFFGKIFNLALNLHCIRLYCVKLKSSNILGTNDLQIPYLSPYLPNLIRGLCVPWERLPWVLSADLVCLTYDTRTLPDVELGSSGQAQQHKVHHRRNTVPSK